MERNPTTSRQISARLTSEGIRAYLDEHSGLVWLPLRQPAWIGITPSEDNPGLWWVVLYEGGA